MATYFSAQAQKAAKVLTNLWETGSFMGDPADITVFGENGTKSDGAGITYGKSQTTENSGGLYKLIQLYIAMNGRYKEALAPYLPQLYRKGGPKRKKDALTKNMTFRALLKKAGKEDPIMSQAQDQHFHKHFFQPALAICEDEEIGFDLRLPMSLAFVYDFCIHSGPGRRWNDGRAYDRLQGWNDKYEPPELEDEVELEKAWTIYMCQKRHAFLKRTKHPATSYRTGSLLYMMRNGGEQAWQLQVPLEFTFFRKAYTGYRDRHMMMTQSDLDKVVVVEATTEE